MAVDEDGGERTRFPCLATARYVVATLVTALAVVVVVMVVTVGVRPGDIRLSVLQGHVEASTLWSERDITIYPNGRRGRRSGGVLHPSVGSRFRPGGGGDGGDDDDTGVHVVPICLGSCPGEPYVSRTYEAAKYVNLRVTLSAYNPSGRTDITCDNITLRVLDVPGGGGDALNVTALVEIGEFRLPRGFPVRRQTSHTLRRWVTVDRPSVLDYIASTYGGRSSFAAMVQVDATITAVSKVAKTSSEHVSQFCWPVTVGVDDPSTSAQSVTCKPRKEFENAIGVALLAPAPAPTVAAD